MRKPPGLRFRRVITLYGLACLVLALGAAAVEGAGSQVTVQELRPSQIEQLVQEVNLTGFDYRVNAVAWSPDGNLLAVGAGNESGPLSGQVSLYETGEWTEQASLEGLTQPAWALAWSPTGKTLAVGSFDNRVYLYHPFQSTTPFQVLESSHGQTTDLAFSPRGDWLAVSYLGGFVRIYETGAWSEAAVDIDLGGPEQGAWALAWSPTGSDLAVGLKDHSLRVYNTTFWTSPRELTQPNWEVRALAFSPEGHWLAAGGLEINLFDYAKGFSENKTFPTANYPVTALAFSPQGGWLAAGLVNASVGLYVVQADSLALTHTFGAFDSFITQVAFNPQGDRLAVASAGGAVALYSPDSDGDGVADHVDPFPADRYEWADSDNDGVGDNTDLRPFDHDNDGTDDGEDRFPTDPAAAIDSDGDGYPNRWNPGKSHADSTTNLTLDAFTDDPTAGLDSDGDGYPDEWTGVAPPPAFTSLLKLDAFPQDPAAALDSDGDGYPNDWLVGREAADSTSGLLLDAFPGDPAAAIDSDGDGYPDEWVPAAVGTGRVTTSRLRLDRFPHDPDEWADSDGDGLGDNADDFPNLAWLQSDQQAFALGLLVAVVAGLLLRQGHRYQLRQGLTHQIEVLNQALKELARFTSSVGLEQAYRLPAQRLLAENDVAAWREGTQLARQGSQRTRQLTREHREVRELFKATQQALARLEAAGQKPDPEPLRAAQEALRQGQPLSQIKALGNKAYHLAHEQIQLSSQARAALEALAQEIEQAKPYVAVDQARNGLDQGKVALTAGKYAKAHRLAGSTMTQLRNDLRKAEPLLVAQVERELPLGVWHRAKLKVSNTGRAHARGVRLRLEGVESQPLPALERLPAGATATMEVALRANQPGTLPLTVILTGSRVYDNGLVSFEQSEWLEVGGVSHWPATREDVEILKGPRFDVKLLRETEFYRGYVRVKIAAHNRSEIVVTDGAVELLFDEQAFRLDRVEPEFRLLGTKALVGNLGPGQKRTLAFYLDPLICTRSQLDGTLAYKDIQGRLHLTKMRPKQVEVICPIFFTPKTANVATLKNLVTEVLEHSDSRVYTLPPALTPEEAFALAKEAMGHREIHHVRTFKATQPLALEAWYYGTTKVKGYAMVMRVAVDELTNSLELYAAAPAQEPLTGLLAELGHDLYQRMEAQGWPIQQITNITIRDSVLNRTSLLFNPPAEEGPSSAEAEGRGSPAPPNHQVNLNLSDAVVNRSQILPSQAQPDTPAAAESPSPESKAEPPAEELPTPQLKATAARKSRRRAARAADLEEGLERLREIEKQLP